jgi:ElaB/YqjD/DUF883 family membrane-anchored ribosome-binding protein
LWTDGSFKDNALTAAERKFRKRVLGRTKQEISMAEARSSSNDLDRALTDVKKRAEGVAKEARNAARDVYGQARESAADVAETASGALTDTVSSFEKVLRRTIETQPYTTLAIGIGIGWLLGRSHRPF